MFQKEMLVTFMNEMDLINESKNKNIDKINYSDFRDRDTFRKSEIIILIKDGEHRVLKSKH